MNSETPRDRQLIKETARLMSAILKASECCLHCEEFDEPREICQKYNQRPPARIIAFGCPDFIEPIPF